MSFKQYIKDLKSKIAAVESSGRFKSQSDKRFLADLRLVFPDADPGQFGG